MRARVLRVLVAGSVLCVVAACYAGVTAASAARTRSAAAGRVGASPDLRAAIDLFGQFHHDLFEPNDAIIRDGRTVKPYFTRGFRWEGEGFGVPISHLAGTLVKGALTRQAGAWLNTREFDPGFYIGGDTDFGERLINKVAILTAGVETKTDLLIRPTPFGYSAYLQLRGPSAPETFTVAGGEPCVAPPDSNYRVRIATGVFATIEAKRPGFCPELPDEPLPPGHAIRLLSTGRQYSDELALLNTARRRARRVGRAILSILAAVGARDANGRPVPTEFNWTTYETTLVIHHRHGHYRYPIVAHLEFIGEPR